MYTCAFLTVSFTVNGKTKTVKPRYREDTEDGSEDGKKVEVRYYSTVKKKYYQSLNQFSLSLEPVSDEESGDTSAVEDGKTPASTDNTAASGCSSALSICAIPTLALMLGTALVVTRKKEN